MCGDACCGVVVKLLNRDSMPRQLGAKWNASPARRERVLAWEDFVMSDPHRRSMYSRGNWKYSPAYGCRVPTYDIFDTLVPGWKDRRFIMQRKRASGGKDKKKKNNKKKAARKKTTKKTKRPCKYGRNMKTGKCKQKPYRLFSKEYKQYLRGMRQKVELRPGQRAPYQSGHHTRASYQ